MHAARFDFPFRFGWLFDRKTDLLFFLFPVLIGFAALELAREPKIASSALWSFVISQGIGIGPFHLGASWAHLEDPKIRQRLIGHKSRKIVALLLVPGIVLFSIIGTLYYYPLLYVLWLILTIQHLVQQNVGILRLYYNYGQEIVPDRDLEAATLQRAAWFWSIVCVLRHGSFADWQQFAMASLAVLSLTWFVSAARRYLGNLLHQARHGLALNVSALLYWLLSVWFLAPFALTGKDYQQGLVIPLVMHWFQYIILNCVLFKRKRPAAPTGGSNLLPHFFMVSSGYAAMVIAVGLFTETVRLTQWQFAIGSGFILSLAFIHYLQDAVVWRFSDPELRERLLPFLKPEVANSERLGSARPMATISARDNP